MRTTLAGAVNIFLTNKEGANIAPATLRKYRTFTNQLIAFAETKGYVMLDQFTPTEIDLFYSKLSLGPRAKAKRLGTLRAFFRLPLTVKCSKRTPLGKISNHRWALIVSPTRLRFRTKNSSASSMPATGCLPSDGPTGKAPGFGQGKTSKISSGRCSIQASHLRCGPVPYEPVARQ